MTQILHLHFSRMYRTMYICTDHFTMMTRVSYMWKAI